MWERYTVPATECPRITKAVLDEERATHGEFSYRSEYMNEFVDDDAQLFSEALVRDAFVPSVLPLWSDDAA
jgi:hypothetical protein